MSDRPQSNKEWIVHSLNIHGAIFERWCARTIGDSTPWELRDTEYPVRFPSLPHTESAETRVDVWAKCSIGSISLNLAIECKKNNPELSNWIFFHRDHSIYDEVNISLLSIRGLGEKWEVIPGINSRKLNLPVVGYGRQTRATFSGKLRDNTKTTTKDIESAAHQAFVGASGLLRDEWEICSRLSENNPRPLWELQYYLPLVVTTANLWLCEFDPSLVSSKTGEIEYEKTSLRQITAAYYEYPIPKYLQFLPGDVLQAVNPASYRNFVWRHILVVQSVYFATLLSTMVADMQSKNDVPVIPLVQLPAGPD